MTKEQIIEQIGKECRVEHTICRYLRIPALSQSLKDTAQNIYIALLSYPEYMIEDLWVNRQINFLIIRIVHNQLSPTGPHGWSQRKATLFESIGHRDFVDEDTL